MHFAIFLETVVIEQGRSALKKPDKPRNDCPQRSMRPIRGVVYDVEVFVPVASQIVETSMLIQ